MTTPSYRPALKAQLAEMNDEQLLAQYQSLTGLLKETRGIPFEQNPSCERDELARLIWEGQANCIDDVLAGALIEWGERTGNRDKVVLVSGGVQ